VTAAHDLSGDALGERLRGLASFPRRAAELRPGQRHAAVAVTVLDASTAPRVLVLKRTRRGLNPSQWALPGGRLDAGETPEQAALREMQEEVGLAGGAVLGLLDDFVSDSGFVITPVVVLAPEPAPLRRNPAEVHSLHPVALARLLADDVLRWAVAPDGARLLQLRLRHDMVVHAPTGAILWQFREAVLGRHARVAELAQPEWTRR
jgi:8-oxo-dGTP pyrophosphatase MutT (NUDIX family)